ncbi:ATP-dependent RNA helicase HrpA [soil metagenome]
MNITYPEALPVSVRRGDIRAAMAAHPVVIVCGDTGSGKTTQLPKIALELGGQPADGAASTASAAMGGRRGRGRIGCTQPRRIAATSVAKRVADELGVVLGQEVGYQIRFEDRTDKERTAVKFMTDGILLAETRGDPLLRQYGTLIIDEAHERSLNVDFILGYLHRLLPKRPDLKIVISSATLDAGAFSDFFHGAPVIQVEGRAFPVEDVYHPPADDRERMADQVARAAEWLRQTDPLGDTLVFLPGEREIREAADLLSGRKYPSTLVLPLFARQAGKDQQAVFQPVPSLRRIILATNVAETSLTIPDIRSVIDSGVARVSRFDPVSGIQRLQIERISKASARQRRGRCGRVSEGICIRLYDEEDFGTRPDFTDPEILRSNLAGVVLQMEHLGLGNPLKFPFIDRPQPKRVADAYRTLEEIGAIHRRGTKGAEKGAANTPDLTEIGRVLARLPLDPRVGRILVGAQDEGCLPEALVLAAALTVQDPRERPQDKQDAADHAHARFRDRRSDFTGWLRWWHAVDLEKRKSGNALRRFCQKHFLNYRRTQEWINLHRELRGILRGLKWALPDPKMPPDDPTDTYSEPLHRAILAAVPSHIGMHKGKKLGYQGARDKTFHLFPGSGVFGSSPAWVMAFERVETAKLYARNVAMIDPAQVEKVAPHVCRYRYANPQWVAEQGAVYGEETVIAFGLSVVEKRRVHYGRIDPAVAREIFILEALVKGETRAPIPVLSRNRQTMDAAVRLEHKLRRRDGLVYPEAIADFYRERVPMDICTQKAFEQWAGRQDPGTLDLTLDDCIVPQVNPIDPDTVPDSLPGPDGETEYPLRYLHDPSDEADGITLILPLADLPHLPPWFGDWLVPLWLEQKVAAHFRALDKDTRLLLPPIREVTDAFLADWDGHQPDQPVSDAVLEFISTEFGLRRSADALDAGRLPAHLAMRYEVVGDDGHVLAACRDLAALQERLAGNVAERFHKTAKKTALRRERLRGWTVGDLPESVSLDRHTVGYPGLVDAGDGTAGLRLWPSASCARHHHLLGVARLYRVTEPERVAHLEGALFDQMSPPSAPPSARKPNPKPVATSGRDGFGSLANAFGGSLPTGRAAPSSQARKNPDSAAAASRFLSPDHLWILGTAGPEPRRNRDDLVTRVLIETLGAPRTEATWQAAVQAAHAELFDETAARICAPLAKILATLDTIGGLLHKDGSYAESLADARQHLDILIAPGWLLAGELAQRLVDFRGLEMRLTRLFGSPPAKDLAKLERYRSAAAGIWADDAPCECGTCFPSAPFLDRRSRDADLRLREFAPELRHR